MSFGKKSFRESWFGIFSFVIALVFTCSAAAFGQTESVSQVPNANPPMTTPKPAALQPVLADYKSVKIGMSAEEVRDTLDKKPKLADKDGFYYIFSDDESAQIRLDNNQKVQFISVTYADAKTAPKYEDVFGSSSPATPAADGKIYNLVRYPEAGYWVAYDRTAGDKPTVTVTIQKMRTAR